ncbi:MAG: diguanylate cyclase [Planctomycetota bacterium]|nr:MAG: diguanylate cyclase [Planctomycetota bacterium]
MRLVIEEGQRVWVQEVADGGPVTIGRALENAVIIEDGAASREHCRLEPDERRRYWLCDLRSRNGTRLNGRFVARALLHSGDRIQIGATVITFHPPGPEGDAAAEALASAAREAGAAYAERSGATLARDPLTGLLSFPALVERLEGLLRGEKAATVSVVKLDVDYLGLVNDMFGLEAGDEVILRVGEAVRSAAETLPGTRCHVGRVAGGCFLVVAPACSLSRARELADLARLRTAELEFDGALRAATLTLSAGVACAPDHGREWRRLLLRAEAALARAKRAGRDRIEAAEPGRDGAAQAFPRAARALADTHVSGLWASSGLWRLDLGGAVPGSADAPEDGTAQPADALRPLVLSRTGQSILGLVAEALGADLELDPLLELVLALLCEKLGARRGFALLRDPRGALRLRAAVDRAAVDGRPPDTVFSQGVLREVERTRAPVLVSDALSDERFRAQESVVSLGIRSAIAVPVLWSEEVLGVLCLDSTSERTRFGEEQRDLLLACGRLLAGPLRRAALHQAQSEELERARIRLAQTNQSEILHRRRYANIIGRSSAMKALFRLMDRLLDNAHPVLIHGESGTGKELVASAIHYNGPRRERPFVAENCAALSESLLEAELFGHVKGAFTGADRDRVGLIEAADGGTLFLDEIGETSPRMQAKLLRVLQEGEVRPVGGSEARRVDVRVIAATNRDLQEMVAAGSFRSDLYYRLAVMTIDLPPLRERREDIPILLEHFLAREAEAAGVRTPGVDSEALALLTHYDWPGNVRELQNEAKKLVALAPERVRPESLSPKFFAGTSTDRAHSAIRRLAVADGAEALLMMIERGRGLAEVLELFEQEVIRRVLAACDGNRSATARRLKLSRPGLHKKMKRYGIE